VSEAERLLSLSVENGLFFFGRPRARSRRFEVQLRRAIDYHSIRLTRTDCQTPESTSEAQSSCFVVAASLTRRSSCRTVVKGHGDNSRSKTLPRGIRPHDTATVNRDQRRSPSSAARDNYARLCPGAFQKFSRQEKSGNGRPFLD